MNGKQWTIFGIILGAALGLATLGFAAMSTSDPYYIPIWIPVSFFIVSGVTLLSAIAYAVYSRLRGKEEKINLRDISRNTYEQVKHDVIRDIQSGKIKIKGMVSGRIENLSNSDKAFIMMLIREMKFGGHGHDDSNGLLADRASGIPLNELITRTCTICGKPRNYHRDD